MFPLAALLSRIWAYPGPAGDHAAIDLSATDKDYTAGLCPRAVYVGTTGDVTIVSLKGVSATYKAVPAGSVIPVGVKTVVKATTTAADLIAMF